MSTAVAAPTVTVSIATFDSAYGRPAFRVLRTDAIGEFKPLAGDEFNPAGATPLLDATAQFISHLESLRSPGTAVIGCLADESGSMAGNEQSVINGINEFVGGLGDVEVDPDTDGKVLAVIVTDGLENASTEVSKDQLASMIERHEENGWTFIYLGANQDAWGESSNIGVRGASSSSYNYVPTAGGTRSAFTAMAQDSAAWLGSTAERLSTKSELGGKTETSLNASGEAVAGYNVADAIAKGREGVTS